LEFFRVKQLLLLIYQPYKWLVYGPLLCLATFVFGSISIPLSLINSKLSYLLCAKPWSYVLTYAIPLFVTVKGGENCNPKESYVVVSNHQSHLDIPALMARTSLGLRWVMKSELRKIPVFGMACDKIGMVYIDRSQPEKAVASLREAKKRVANGISVMFFAEGTRSRTGELGTFKKGAFRMAIELGVPILPISIKGTRNSLPAKTLDLKPGKASITIHPPIPMNNYSVEDLEKLMTETKEVIQLGM
jgi:1-acyl-sn-glycerol-3-phosphate acyltransferase